MSAIEHFVLSVLNVNGLTRTLYIIWHVITVSQIITFKSLFFGRLNGLSLLQIGTDIIKANTLRSFNQRLKYIYIHFISQKCSNTNTINQDKHTNTHTHTHMYTLKIRNIAPTNNSPFSSYNLDRHISVNPIWGILGLLLIHLCKS